MGWVLSLRHTQHACSPTLASNAKSHYLCCPSYPSSFPLFFPLYTPHAVKSQDFSPPPLFVSYILSNSNSSFSSFFFLIMTKEQLPELAPAGIHGNNPSTSSPFSFNPHQSFPKMHPTPLTPWLPFLLNWSTADLNVSLKKIKISLIMRWTLTLLAANSFVAALLMTPPFPTFLIDYCLFCIS